jgi:hypothetical protein
MNPIQQWAASQLENVEPSDITAVWIASVDGDLWGLAETPTDDMARAKYLGDTVQLHDIVQWLTPQ